MPQDGYSNIWREVLAEEETPQEDEQAEAELQAETIAQTVDDFWSGVARESSDAAVRIMQADLQQAAADATARAVRQIIENPFEQTAEEAPQRRRYTSFTSNVPPPIEPSAHCFMCERAALISEMTSIADQLVCRDCYTPQHFRPVVRRVAEQQQQRPQTSFCSHCYADHPPNRLTTIGDRRVCNICRERRYVQCDTCNTTIRRGDHNVVTTDADGNQQSMCGECFRSSYTSCYRCHVPLHVENDTIHEHHRPGYNTRRYCTNCFENLDSPLIYRYDYKPDPIFHGRSNAKRYYGWELEVEGSRGMEKVQTIHDIFNQNAEHVYFKNDGSLDNGFEIVSHPATFQYITSKMPWRKAFKKLRSMGYRSHDTDTCGLHIHISREAFGDYYNGDEQEYNIGRLIYLAEKFYPQILQISRRSEENMERWARRYGTVALECPKKAFTNVTEYCTVDKYRLINITHSKTVEIRAFRGTLIEQSFLATLQFVHHLVNVAMSSANIETMTWEEFKQEAYKAGLIEFTNYCEEKGI